MTLWMKTAVVFSVCLLLFFGYTINKVHSTEYVPDTSYLTPLMAPMPLVRKDVDFDKLVENLPTDRQYFRQVFFEIMNLRGMQKNKFGSWLAIFTDEKGNLVRLGSGDTYDGVKIESTSETGCVVRYGNIERRFVLP